MCAHPKCGLKGSRSLKYRICKCLLLLNLVKDEKRRRVRSEVFLAEVQATLTGTLMAGLSNCPTSVGERVCTNLVRSLLSCSSVAVCVMELTAGHHFF